MVAMPQIDVGEYKYGFRDSDAHYSFKSGKGLTREVVEQISEMKSEPNWMRELRLQALDVFWQKPTPTWGGELRDLNFDDRALGYGAQKNGPVRRSMAQGVSHEIIP